MPLTFKDVAFDADSPIPGFRDPPVIEVSQGFMFATLPNFSSIKLGRFYDRLSSNFPEIQEQPRLPPNFETFGSADGGNVSLRLEIAPAQMSPRYFFISEDKHDLIQVQSDRFHFNWRKLADESPYPRFEALRDTFNSNWDHYVEWAKSELGAVPELAQCEISYVNRIPIEKVDGSACGLSNIFFWLKGLPGTTEDGSFNYRQRLIDENGTPVARLVCSINYGTMPDGKREAIFELTVRGRPANHSLNDMLQFLSDGREIIVRSFTGLTSEYAHSMWGRYQ